MVNATTADKSKNKSERPSKRPPRPGEALELRIDGVAQGGAGVARADGFVVFVAGAYPGDLVRAEITKSKRHYADARVVALVEPSPDRVPTRCDHEGGECPGSPWQALRYELQAERKHELLDDALRRLGGLDGFELEPFVAADAAADSIWRYRNKMEYSFGQNDAGEVVVGFHRRGRFDLIDDARDCMLASERSNAVRNFVRDWSRSEGLDAHDRRAGRGFLRNLVIREGRRTGDLQVRVVTSEAASEAASESASKAAGEDEFRVDALAEMLRDRYPEASVLWTRTAALAEVTQFGDTTVVAGAERLEEELGGLRFRISPEAFFQTNTQMAERLYGIAAEYAELRGTERVFDLYCGIGTLTLPLALRAGEVFGVDVVETAVADAIANAELNEIENAHFFAGDARTAIQPLHERAPRPDVVVVDPPRAGLSKKVVRRLLELRARRIVYVSCNATTLAPNARQIVDEGYRLVKVRGVDMFPHTPHLECVALLERVDA
jgi:23S rRNA (uracil1939-C5)-methyltransferase